MSDAIAWEVSKALAGLRGNLDRIKTIRKCLENKPADDAEVEDALLSLRKNFNQAEGNLLILEEASSFRILSAGTVDELGERRTEFNALILWQTQELNKLRDSEIEAWNDTDRFGKIEPLVKATRESTSKEMRNKYLGRIVWKGFELFVTCSAVFFAAKYFS